MDLLRATGLVSGAILLILFALGIYAVHETTSLNLPLSTFSQALSILIPLVQIATILLFFLPTKLDIRLLLASAWIASLFDMVLLTTASFESSSAIMTCQLERAWQQWFQAKMARQVRGVQDALQCCGLRSEVDRAWPFPDASHGADACVQAYGRRNSCLPPWEAEARKALGLFLAIGAVSLILKILVLGAAWLRTRPEAYGGLPSWHQGNQRGLLESGDAENTENANTQQYTDAE